MLHIRVLEKYSFTWSIKYKYLYPVQVELRVPGGGPERKELEKKNHKSSRCHPPTVAAQRPSLSVVASIGRRLSLLSQLWQARQSVMEGARLLNKGDVSETRMNVQKHSVLRAATVGGKGGKTC